MYNVEVWAKSGIDTKSLFENPFENWDDAYKCALKLAEHNPVTIWHNNCRVMDF